jgi:predicted ATPase
MIIDNFEQVVDLAAPTVGRWLARAGNARFLVTSREKLRLGAQEQVLAVGPLSIEMGVELLAVRARRLRPGLEFVGPEAESVREIVRLVDGMPLAIELAGARMRVMSATQIVAQMRSRFSLLTGGGSARHETLVIAIDGS